MAPALSVLEPQLAARRALLDGWRQTLYSIQTHVAADPIPYLVGHQSPGE